MKTILIFDNDVYVRFISKMAYAKKPDIKYEEVDNAPLALEKLKTGAYDFVVFGFPQKDFSADDVKSAIAGRNIPFCIIDKETGPIPPEIKSAACCIFSKKLDKSEAFKKLVDALSAPAGKPVLPVPEEKKTEAPAEKKIEITPAPSPAPKIIPAPAPPPSAPVAPPAPASVPSRPKGPETPAGPASAVDKPAETPSPPPAQEEVSGVIKKILIADDDDTIRELIKTILGPIYEYVDARDGSELVNRAKMNNPDLIITDIIMPGLSGYRAVGELRVDKKFLEVPAIFTSARAKDKGLFETLKPKGYSYFIPKPYDRHQFASFVKEIITKHPVPGHPK